MTTPTLRDVARYLGGIVAGILTVVAMTRPAIAATPNTGVLVAMLALLLVALGLGRGPGLLATGVIVGVFWPRDPAFRNYIRIALFAAGGGGVSLMAGWWREARARAETTLESITDAFYALDRRWRFVYVNRECQRVMGRPERALIGRRLTEVFPQVEGTEFERQFARAMREREAAHFEAEMAGAWFEVHAYPSDRGLAVAFRDVSGRKAMEAELRAARDEAEAAGRAKDRFLATLSHELRTPLTPALITLDALGRDDRLPADVRDDLAVARRNVEMEARLIDDLLDLTRVAHGRLVIDPGPVDAHAVAREAAQVCRPEAEAKGVDLRLDLRAGAYAVRGDAARLRQVLWNLVKNATKFTPPGGAVTVSTEDLPGGRLRVTVADTGVGMTGEALERIFRPFEQAGEDTRRRFGGLGLGLAISRALVEAHGGAIAARSDGPDRGACFSVELPGARRPAAAGLPEGESTAEGYVDGATGRPLRILLVEDHEDTRGVLARLLRRAGHEVTPAATVADALDAAARAGFDLMVSDLGLPDGSGLDLMRQLRPLAAIALTGYGMDADAALCREAGFVSHLTKPIDFPRLQAEIRQVAELCPAPST